MPLIFLPFEMIIVEELQYIFFKNKYEENDKLVHFKKLEENETEKKIKTIQYDNDTDYIDRQTIDLALNSEIQLRSTIPGDSPSNWRTESLNRTLLNKARCMILYSGLAKSFWAEDVAMAAYINNRIPKHSLNRKIQKKSGQAKPLILLF